MLHAMKYSTIAKNGKVSTYIFMIINQLSKVFSKMVYAMVVGIAINNVIFNARLDLEVISFQFFTANSSDILGIILITKALVTVKGRNNRGIAMPDIFPKISMEVMAEYPAI